jgi:hypothetical protein
VLYLNNAGLGLLVILEAIKVLANPRLHLVVAGDDRPEKFSAAVNKAGLNNQLHFIGNRIAVDNISG